MRRICQMTLWLGLPLCAAGAPLTDVETVTRYLETKPLTWEVDKADAGKAARMSVRVLSAEEAVSAIDTIFSKKFLPGGNDVIGYPRLKRLVKDGLAVAFAYDVETADDVRIVWRGCKKDPSADDSAVATLRMRRKSSSEGDVITGSFTGYGYWLRTFDSDVNTRSQPVTIYPRVCRGVEFAVPKNGGRVRGVEWSLRDDMEVLPFKLARLETSFSEVECGSTPDVEVIADVEDVALDELVNLNASKVPSSYDWHSASRFRGTVFSYHSHMRPLTPSAVYRVELLTRKILKGNEDLDRIVFKVDPERYKDRRSSTCWPFFRGMTLKVQLIREEGALRVICAEPVLPYPPYTPACAQPEYFERLQPTAICPRFAVNKVAFELPTNAVASICVAYGDHTLAKFYSTVNDVTGTFGAFPDYSRTCRVDVWTAREGADQYYWNSAWFAGGIDSMDEGFIVVHEERVVVHDVEEGLDEEKRLKFAWYGVKFPESVREQPLDLGKVVSELNRVTVCPHCKKAHYRITADPSVLARVVDLRPDKTANGAPDELDALDALRLACGLAGCTCELKDGEIAIAAEHSAEEMADHTLVGLLRILEKDGFASVVDAEYVNRREPFFKSDGTEGECPNIWFAVKDVTYGLSGRGWRRKTPEGQFQYLAFDSVWWTVPEEDPWDPATTARPMRDAAKMRASMQDDYMQLKDSPKTDERDANERSQTIRLLYAGYHRRTQANSGSSDVYALAHALHLLQLGRVQEAQSLYDVLRLRPFAAQRAFARLRARTKLGRLYPDYQSFASQRREKGEGGKEKEVGDEQ